MSASAVDLVRAVRRMTTGRQDVLALVQRPGSPVVHLYSGPLTPSGCWVPRSGRTVGGTRTKRLSVLERSLRLLEDDGLRCCAHCTARLTAHIGRAVHPVTRDQNLDHYRGLTLSDLAVAVRISTTVDDTHRIGFVLSLLFGPAPVRRPVETSVRQAVFDLNAGILAARRRLTALARTPEEVEAAARAREVEEHNARLAEAGRRRTARIDRLTERHLAGSYLTRSEKDLIGMTG